MKGTRKITNQDLYTFSGENKIYVKEYLLTNYLFEEKAEEIKWELTTETKLLAKINCQKAIANFKGRKWIAWFAPDIPYQYGPWKLNGLPGLILEAYDDKEEIQYLFAGFETKDSKTDNASFINDVTVISLPKDVNKVTLADINKLKASMYKDSRAFFIAQTNASEGKVDGKLIDGLSFKKINNPIDLTENN